jgi:hypothetical protein
MELLKYINNKEKTYSIANLLVSKAIVEVCSKEELSTLIHKIKCSSLVQINMDIAIWDRYVEGERFKDKYKGSIAIHFNSNSIEFCSKNWYMNHRSYRYYPIYKYSEIIVVST